jgi:hypothetical protein
MCCLHIQGTEALGSSSLHEVITNVTRIWVNLLLQAILKFPVMLRLFTLQFLSGLAHLYEKWYMKCDTGDDFTSVLVHVVVCNDTF